MLLTKFIPKNCIEADLPAPNKADGLRTLAGLLFRNKRLKGETAAIAQMLSREAIESTGIGRGIAIPHARTPELDELYCAVGRVVKGVDFNAVDRKPVRLIFLICYPPARQTTYLNFIATVAQLLRDDEPVRAMMGAASAKEMFEILERHGETMVRPEENARRKKPATGKGKGPAAGTSLEIMLLARLDLCTEMLQSARSGKKQIEGRIANISALLAPEVLHHYRRLKKGGKRALVAVEGGVCQGCFTKLATELAQSLRRDSKLIHRCGNCHRFIYAA